MQQNNEGLNSQNKSNNDSLENDIKDQLKNSDTVTVQGTTFTREEVEEANKPQPNIILDKLGGPNNETTRDNERVNARANEASDFTDTNTGGLVSGAAKGANQS